MKEVKVRRQFPHERLSPTEQQTEDTARSQHNSLRDRIKQAGISLSQAKRSRQEAQDNLRGALDFAITSNQKVVDIRSEIKDLASGYRDSRSDFLSTFNPRYLDTLDQGESTQITDDSNIEAEDLAQHLNQADRLLAVDLTELNSDDSNIEVEDLAQHLNQADRLLAVDLTELNSDDVKDHIDQVRSQIAVLDSLKKTLDHQGHLVWTSKHNIERQIEQTDDPLKAADLMIQAEIIRDEWGRDYVQPVGKLEEQIELLIKQVATELKSDDSNIEVEDLAQHLNQADRLLAVDLTELNSDDVKDHIDQVRSQIAVLDSLKKTLDHQGHLVWTSKHNIERQIEQTDDPLKAADLMIQAEIIRDEWGRDYVQPVGKLEEQIERLIKQVATAQKFANNRQAA